MTDQDPTIVAVRQGDLNILLDSWFAGRHADKDALLAAERLAASLRLTPERVDQIPPSNTADVFRYAIGRTIIGVLRSALPVSRPDLAKGNKTLVFDDGTALTMTSGGAYRIERAEDVDRAVKRTQQKLDDAMRDYQAILDLAGHRPQQRKDQTNV